MLVQSSSGKVYAILAETPEYEVGILPAPHLISTTLFFILRLRYKARMSDQFDPLLAPKNVLVGGIERSDNTLRGSVVFNTGFTLDKVGASTPELSAQRLYKAAPSFLLVEDSVLKPEHVRDDFVADFTKLAESAIAPFYPAKDCTQAPILSTPFDLNLWSKHAPEPSNPFKVVPGGSNGEENVKKVSFGKAKAPEEEELTE